MTMQDCELDNELWWIRDAAKKAAKDAAKEAAREAKKKGRQSAILFVVKNMMSQGLDIPEIARLTGIKSKEIKKLLAEAQQLSIDSYKNYYLESEEIKID